MYLYNNNITNINAHAHNLHITVIACATSGDVSKYDVTTISRVTSDDASIYGVTTISRATSDDVSIYDDTTIACATSDDVSTFQLYIFLVNRCKVVLRAV